MLKGLALTPPIVGRISIGRVAERGDKRLPEKDDEFTLTSQLQNADGWVPHPLNESLRERPAGRDRAAKLRSIPVRLLFDDPALNMRAAYTRFDRKTGRPLCVGNGESCRRSTSAGVQALPCPAPEGCEFAEGQCKPFGRLNVRVGDEDELGSFIFRTAGFNSIRTLATRLRYFAAVSGGRLSTLPLELRLRGKSTTQSHRTPIYYVDLTLRSGLSLTEGIQQAKIEWETKQSAGFDQPALDQAARESLALGAFEESMEDSATIVDEFYPEAGSHHGRREQSLDATTTSPGSEGLAGTLASKLGIPSPVKS